MSGPFRTRVRKVTLLPVTPLEKWQGFDVRIQVEADMVGSLVVPGAMAGETSQLGGTIARRSDGVREAVASLPSLPSSSPIIGTGAVPTPTPTVGDIVPVSAPLAVRVAAPVFTETDTPPDPIVFLARIPIGKEGAFKKVTLHGKVRGKLLSYVGKNPVPPGVWQTSRNVPDFAWTWARPAPFSISLDAKKLSDLNAQVSHEQVRLESAKVDFLPPRALLSRPSSGFTVGGDGETQALFNFSPPPSSREQKASNLPSDWSFSGEMRDSRGKIIALTQPRLPPWAATSPVGKSLLISILPTLRYGREHGPIWELRLPVRDIPRSRGEVFYQGLVSYKDCWPRPFKIR